MRGTVRPVAGRVVAITGGARGIGRATAEALAERGARVAIGDLDGALAREVAGRLGGVAVGLEVDVTRRESFRRFLDATQDHLGLVDVLINNAGVLHVGAFLEEDEAWSQRQLEVNVLGVVNGMKLALPQMRLRGTGHVVNLGSGASRFGVPREAVYSATKHAVAGLSEAVRLELRGTGVEISLVMPGLVRTELSAGTLDAPGTSVIDPEAVAAAIVATLERPRFDVYVPRRFGVAHRLLSVMPQAMRETAMRVLGFERFTARTTSAARAEYERRAERLAARRPPG